MPTTAQDRVVWEPSRKCCVMGDTALPRACRGLAADMLCLGRSIGESPCKMKPWGYADGTADIPTGAHSEESETPAQRQQSAVHYPPVLMLVWGLEDLSSPMSPFELNVVTESVAMTMCTDVFRRDMKYGKGSLNHTTSASEWIILTPNS